MPHTLSCPLFPTRNADQELENEYYNSAPSLKYKDLDKSKYFYQLKAFGFFKQWIVGFAGLDGFNGLGPHIQD